MLTRQQRREANKSGRFYNVDGKSGVNSFFTNQVLLEQIQQAVQLVIRLLVEGNLLANLHVLRCTHVCSGQRSYPKAGPDILQQMRLCYLI